MTTLLEKIGIINYKYEALNDQDAFNLFELLRDKGDEVHLHSKFLAELLNTKGQHPFGDSFLQQFLETLDLKDFKTGDYEVLKEYKNIDILIRNKRQTIIIENKIWAGDQPQQLERYYKSIKHEGFTDIRIYYLTLKGHAPSEDSVGDLEAPVELISYAYHIDTWLEKCIAISSRHPGLREALIQYQKLINDLTGNSMVMEQRLELITLLAENDNIFKAQKIAENWIHVRWHTEFDFWTDFETIISEEYTLLDSHKYSPDQLNSVLHQSRNRNPWYGLKFKIGDFHGYELCLYLERGLGNTYYGLYVENADAGNILDDAHFRLLTKAIEPFCDWEQEGSWLGGKWLYPEISFESFSNEATLKLVQPDFRARYIQDNWTNIKVFIEHCKSALTTVSPQIPLGTEA